MLKIDLLKNHPEAIPELSNIWHEVLGKIWMPEIEMEEIESLYWEELQADMPLTHVAIYDQIPVGSCTLHLKDDFRPELEPWIGDLVVHPSYQKQGIGKILLSTAVKKASELGYNKIYLFTFDPKIPAYYQQFGWKVLGIDTYKSHPVTVMELFI